MLTAILERDGYNPGGGDGTNPWRSSERSRRSMQIWLARMPEVDESELRRRLEPPIGDGKRVPLLTLTAAKRPSARLQVRDVQKRLHDRNAALDNAVANRTAELERGWLEILPRLALAPNTATTPPTVFVADRLRLGGRARGRRDLPPGR